MQTLYGLVATGMLAGIAAIQFFGWAPTSVDKIPNAPKDIRNNPAAYRSFYYVGGFGGK